MSMPDFINPTIVARLTLMFIIFNVLVLASASYRYIEVPLRSGQRPHRLGQALAADPQSHPRLQSGARRVDDAQ